MKKNILKTTKSILIAAAICASLVFGVFASVAGSSSDTIVAAHPTIVGNY